MRCRCLLVSVIILAGARLSAQAPPLSQARSDVEITGGLSSSFISKDHDVGFWIRILNRSDQEITGLRIGGLDGPSAYSIVSCWNSEPTPRATATGVCSVSPATLARGQEISMGGMIRANALAEQQTIGLVVGWTGNKLSSSHEVPLGQLSSDSRLTYWLETHPVLVSLFGVTLLGLIGYGVKQGLESSRHDAEIERTRQAETWNQLLKEAGSFSLNYYLPAEGALQSFIGQTRKHLKSVADAKPEKESAEARLSSRLAFYYWAYFERRMLLIKRRIGGVHFKDYTGEEIVTVAYTRYRNLCYARNENARKVVDDLLEQMPLKTTVSEFLQKLDGTQETPPEPTVLAAWNFFHRWLHKDDALAALKTLEVMQVILDYELNRPYYYWYGSLEPLELSDTQLEELLSFVGYAVPGASPAETKKAEIEAREWRDVLTRYFSRSKYQ